MKAVGIVAEYNPFHNGHRWHLEQAKLHSGCSHAVVVMSGHFVQRGEPAIFDKWSRATMAIAGGVDLVLEMPVLSVVRSAQYFAVGGVRLLERLGIISHMSFGMETIDPKLSLIASAIDDKTVKRSISCCLKDGQSYAAAVANSIAAACNVDLRVLSSPNNILAIEYMRALQKYAPEITPIPIIRKGHGFHDTAIDGNFASASALRLAMQANKQINAQVRSAMPDFSHKLCQKLLQEDRGPLTLNCLENIILAKLRTAGPAALAQIPDVSEGLEYKIFASSLHAGDIEGLLQSIKSKRYPQTRLQRILIQLLLEITKKQIDRFNEDGPLYARVLAFNDRGRSLIKGIQQHNRLPVITKVSHYLTSKQRYQHALTPLQKMLSTDVTATDLYLLGLSNPVWRRAGRDFLQSPVYLR